MRYFLITLLVCLTAFAAVFNGPAWSQYNNGSCEQADSTAANLECINRHYQIMQDKLKTVFKKAGGQDEAAGPLLGAAQKDWLVYRDSQCKWEAELPKVPALKRVYELSCLTALTEKRIAVLQAAVKHEQADKPREFGAQPRWMNALAHDYPKTFWRYGEWKSADMDCDGEDDAIMTGIDVAQVAEEATGDGKDSGDETRAEIAVVVAISDNPPAGRPKARLLKIPVGGKGGATTPFCISKTA